MDVNRVVTGDCFEVLADLPDESVNMCMSSPPYWNLRDYGVEGQLGQEQSAEEYVDNIASVMDEVKRVLRPDGSLWLNLGDTYDDKDLQQIPARVAIELQDRGWILRNRVTWLKPGGGLPQSVGDRLTNTTEAIFHLTKNRKYWYDLDSIRIPHSTTEQEYRDKLPKGENNKTFENSSGSDINEYSTDEAIKQRMDLGKNPGDVFEVTTKPFPDAHFAVYPQELCEKPIKSTCPPDGVVLDPFAGAGTTLLKAKELRRDFLGIELNPEYADMARARIGLNVRDPSHITDDEAARTLAEWT
jgi:DNA modification methylase